jgi:hypothetical protein
MVGGVAWFDLCVNLVNFLQINITTAGLEITAAGLGILVLFSMPVLIYRYMFPLIPPAGRQEKEENCRPREPVTIASFSEYPH